MRLGQSKKLFYSKHNKYIKFVGISKKLCLINIFANVKIIDFFDKTWSAGQPNIALVDFG
ncbi:hypothetical protein F5ESL0236_04865 [Lactobacillus sp. ESL0236]|nr:hypothetical protein F5ESL0237_04855 [Lactobacillus sp. ESL0237]RMC43385.1 hypothetical protein F5ESL0234_04860 [Lactobacillus sp. ESL0234]RMC44297.1 hypothetical protein F5ESL0236_04865 [Lactobacillus sp. ESL0236]